MIEAIEGSTRKPAIASRAREPNACSPRPVRNVTATSSAMATTKATSSTYRGIMVRIILRRTAAAFSVRASRYSCMKAESLPRILTSL